MNMLKRGMDKGERERGGKITISAELGTRWRSRGLVLRKGAFERSLGVSGGNEELNSGLCSERMNKGGGPTFTDSPRKNPCSGSHRWWKGFRRKALNWEEKEEVRKAYPSDKRSGLWDEGGQVPLLTSKSFFRFVFPGGV